MAGEAKAITAGKAALLNRQIKVWQSQHKVWQSQHKVWQSQHKVWQCQHKVWQCQHRDSVFSDLFGSKANLLELYRALHPEDSKASEADIANVTMKNILMVDLYNDLGFTVRDKLLLLVEAQSTWTENVVLRMFLYLAETWGEYIKTTEQNVYGAKKVTLPKTELYVIFTGERKDKPDVISLFEQFHPCDEGIVELKTRVIFASESEADGKLDILQQYIAFSKEINTQIKQKGRTTEALIAAIEICKQRNILCDYLTVREKEVVKTMTMLFDQGYVNEIARKESPLELTSSQAMRRVC